MIKNWSFLATISRIVILRSFKVGRLDMKDYKLWKT